MNKTENDQLGLFKAPEPIEVKSPKSQNMMKKPLAHRARPDSFEYFYGQEHIFQRYPFLMTSNFPSLILWGPPGTGKTTLAYLLANKSEKELYVFNAVLGGVNDLKKLIYSALEIKKLMGKHAIIFIDEIHRFNKAQQDALLPFVEEGAFTLIGATTENPRSAINRSLLSRVQIVELKALSRENILNILQRINDHFRLKLEVAMLELIADFAYGDARRALNILDVLENQTDKATLNVSQVKRLILENAREYDRNKDRHYDVISAFIKSMRGSDPDAALLWLAVMLDGGEDPVFIARRLVIFASEDIGNADPDALKLSVAALSAVQSIGMPEAKICLAQATTYLAASPKSNAAYLAINEATQYVESNATIEVPEHLRNLSKEIKGYKYPHDFPNHYIKQKYTKEDIPNFYRPTEMGKEKFLKSWLKNIYSSD